MNIELIEVVPTVTIQKIFIVNGRILQPIDERHMWYFRSKDVIQCLFVREELIISNRIDTSNTESVRELDGIMRYIGNKNIVEFMKRTDEWK